MLACCCLLQMAGLLQLLDAAGSKPGPAKRRRSILEVARESDPDANPQCDVTPRSLPTEPARKASSGRGLLELLDVSPSLQKPAVSTTAVVGMWNAGAATRWSEELVAGADGVPTLARPLGRRRVESGGHEKSQQTSSRRHIGILDCFWGCLCLPML